jgi:hypothetical protein
LERLEGRRKVSLTTESGEREANIRDKKFPGSGLNPSHCYSTHALLMKNRQKTEERLSKAWDETGPCFSLAQVRNNKGREEFLLFLHFNLSRRTPSDLAQ